MGGTFKKEETEGISADDRIDDAKHAADKNEGGTKGCNCCCNADECFLEWSDP